MTKKEQKYVNSLKEENDGLRSLLIRFVDAVHLVKILDCFFEKDNSSDLKAASTHDKVTDGLKHDGGKPRLDLVPPEIIEAVGTVMTHGAEKYGEASYRNVEPKRYRAALMRHICKWLKDPYGKDEDSGLPHLWHVACNVAFLLELDKKETKGEFR